MFRYSICVEYIQEGGIQLLRSRLGEGVYQTEHVCKKGRWGHANANVSI